MVISNLLKTQKLVYVQWKTVNTCALYRYFVSSSIASRGIIVFLSYSLWRNWWLFYTALEPRNKGQGKLNLSWLFPNTNFSVRSDNFKEPIRCSLTTKIFFQLTNIHLIPQFYLHVTIHFVCTICLLKMPSLCGNKRASLNNLEAFKICSFLVFLEHKFHQQSKDNFHLY